ncbi:MAG TPA: hypothetical protein VE685_09195 [Thermoanaerobaculia bacterium]|nr:hypothetical protein [Thermoanaerobaculia bacterium]
MPSGAQGEVGRETSPALRLAAVGVLSVLYLVTFFLAPELFGEEGRYWLNVLLALVLAGFAGRAAWERRGTMQIFFVLLAGGFLACALANFTYQKDATDAAGEASMAGFVVFLFTWGCAWGLLALELLRRSRAQLLVKGLAVGMLVTLCTLFLMFYQAPQAHEWGTLAVRFEIVIAILELAGVVLSLTCVLLGAGPAYVLLASGFGVSAANDLLAVQLERVGQEGLAERLDFLWTLGLFLFLAGFVLLRRSQDGALGELDAASSKHSGLSGLLLLISMGAVLLAAVANRLLAEAWLSFFFVLFTLVCVIVMTRITAGFDRALRFAEEYSRDLLTPGLETPGWSARARRLRGALETTGLADLLDVLEGAAARLRQEVIFLGPERLNRPALRRRTGGRATCFIVMPFSREWSDAVQSLIRRSCETEGVSAIRGDDLFKPTDILDDIWQGIAGADFVIADITDRNPNVLYELGLAHAIAKPVVILSQLAEDIPVDLATRRVILYQRADLEQDQGAALLEKLGKTIRQVCQEYGFVVEPTGRTAP